MLTVDGIPAHPLVVHAVVVLLPLAAVGTLLVVARPHWRRQLGVWVLLLAAAGVASVPVAVRTGEQLKQALGGGTPLVAVHENRAETLPFPALIFLVLLAATVFAGRRADRLVGWEGPGAAHALVTGGNVAIWRWITLALGVLAAIAGLVVTGIVVLVGHSGSEAVWLA
jgi:hypothetical protein